MKKRRPRLIRVWGVACHIGRRLHGYSLVSRRKAFAIADIRKLDTDMTLRCSPHKVVELRGKA